MSKTLNAIPFQRIAPAAFLLGVVCTFLPFLNFNWDEAQTQKFSAISLLLPPAELPSGGRIDEFTVIETPNDDPEKPPKREEQFAHEAEHEFFSTLQPDAWVVVLGGVLALLAPFIIPKKELGHKIQAGAGLVAGFCAAILIADVYTMKVHEDARVAFEPALFASLALFLLGSACAVGTLVVEMPKDAEYTVGTLKYNNWGLIAIFFWVLWGDFCFSLLGSIFGAIFPLQLNALGASPQHMATMMSTIPAALGMLLVPVISFKSDRYRSRLGRRIPFMLFTAPFLCGSLVLLGYSREIAEYMQAHAASLPFGLSPLSATLLVLGTIVVLYQFFGDFVGSVYYYLFADVVPQQFMGQFMGLFRVIGALAGYVFNTYAFGYAQTHTKAIYWSIAILYLIGFGLMCWRIKEGQYPPVKQDAPGFDFFTKILNSARNYFKECFTHPLFVCLFLFNALWSMSNACGIYRNIFYLEMCDISLSEIGKVAGWMGLLSLVLYYPMGVLVDKVTPMRALLMSTILLIPSTLAGYFITGKTSFIAVSMVTFPINAIWDATTMPLMVQMLPKERFGQFCSANALVNNVARLIIPQMGAAFIVYTGLNYRLIWIWQTVFMVIAFGCLVVVYLQWKRCGGDNYVAPSLDAPADPGAPALAEPASALAPASASETSTASAK